MATRARGRASCASSCSREGSAVYKHHYPRLQRAIEALMRGSRVNHGEALTGELLRLWEWGCRKPEPSGSRSRRGGTKAGCSESNAMATLAGNEGLWKNFDLSGISDAAIHRKQAL